MQVGTDFIDGEMLSIDKFIFCGLGHVEDFHNLNYATAFPL